jgi:hypothetical protein
MAPPDERYLAQPAGVFFLPGTFRVFSCLITLIGSDFLIFRKSVSGDL